jgi:hypothetical protein
MDGALLVFPKPRELIEARRRGQEQPYRAVNITRRADKIPGLQSWSFSYGRI